MRAVAVWFSYIMIGSLAAIVGLLGLWLLDNGIYVLGSVLVVAAATVIFVAARLAGKTLN